MASYKKMMWPKVGEEKELKKKAMEESDNVN